VFILDERRFSPTYALRLLWALLLLIPAAGLAWIAFVDRETPELGILGVAFGIVLVYAVIWIALSRVALVICPEGLRRESMFGSEEILWSEIVDARYRVTPIRVYGHFGLVGALIALASTSSKFQNVSLTLQDETGKKIAITSNFLGAKEAIALALSKFQSRIIAVFRTRLDAGEILSFGKVSLSRTHLTLKGKSIPIEQLKSACLDGRNLRIRQEGKWLDVLSIPSDRIPNVLALLALLQEKAPLLATAGKDYLNGTGL
jgi:hypothetical protein